MLIKIKVFPGSKKEEVIKKGEDSFEVKVREKPVAGRANEALFAILTQYFNVPRSKIKLLKGAKQRNKIFEVVI